MKTKTSITLSDDLIRAIDKLAGKSKNRSEFIETAVRTYIAQMIRQERNARDLEIINQRADRLNEEALDVLAYQWDVFKSRGQTLSAKVGCTKSSARHRSGLAGLIRVS